MFWGEEAGEGLGRMRWAGRYGAGRESEAAPGYLFWGTCLKASCLSEVLTRIA